MKKKKRNLLEKMKKNYIVSPIFRKIKRPKKEKKIITSARKSPIFRQIKCRSKHEGNITTADIQFSAKPSEERIKQNEGNQAKSREDRKEKKGHHVRRCPIFQRKSIKKMNWLKIWVDSLWISRTKFNKIFINSVTCLSSYHAGAIEAT